MGAEASLEVLIGMGVGIFTTWGLIWYRIGRLQEQVKGNTKKLADIEAKIDNHYNSGGKNA